MNRAPDPPAKTEVSALPASSKKILYVTSWFPALNETFIAREILEIERRGFDVIVVPLHPSGQEVGPAEMPRAEVWHTPYVSWPVITGAFAEFVRSPLAVSRNVAYITLRLLRKPARAAKFFAVLPKALYLMRRLRGMRIVHIHSHWATVPTTFAMFLSGMMKTPFSFSAHAWDIYVSGNEYLLKEKIVRADRVFTCTAANKRRLCEFGDEKKIEVMYHGIEIGRYPFNPDKAPGFPFILAGGSLVPQKGLDDLVKALGMLRRAGVEFRAEIFGKGTERGTLESLIERNDLAGRVELIGTRPHEEVIGLMGKADIFVMPSKRAPRGFVDGLPNVVAEAMACGACVVASRFSGIPELVEDGVDGVLVDPGDVAGFAAAIKNLLQDNQLRREIRVNARAKVEAVFDVRRNVEPLADYFERIVGRDGGGD